MEKSIVRTMRTTRKANKFRETRWPEREPLRLSSKMVTETIDDNWLISANLARCAPRGFWWRGTKNRHKPLIDEPLTARRSMTTTATNHETREQVSIPWIGTEPRIRFMGKCRWQMETTPRQTTDTILPTRSRATTKDHQKP